MCCYATWRTNLAITQAVQDQGYYYAPDPSSQLACSIGGNIAENWYGFITKHEYDE